MWIVYYSYLGFYSDYHTSLVRERQKHASVDRRWWDVDLWVSSCITNHVLHLALHIVNSEKKLLLVRICVCNNHIHQKWTCNLTDCAPECLGLVLQISAEDRSRKMKNIPLWKLDPDRESIGLLWPKALPKVSCGSSDWMMVPYASQNVSSAQWNEGWMDLPSSILHDPFSSSLIVKQFTPKETSVLSDFDSSGVVFAAAAVFICSACLIDYIGNWFGCTGLNIKPNCTISKGERSSSSSISTRCQVCAGNVYMSSSLLLSSSIYLNFASWILHAWVMGCIEWQL